MLTILNDPAGVTGARRVALDYGITLQANIERHLSGGEGAELRINGQPVDPLTDPRMDAPPSRFDMVTVCLRPAGLESLTLAIIAVVASVAISYALIPDISTPSAAKESPNNRLTGQTNVARAYQARPDVYGYRRVWPDLIQPSTVEYIDHIKYVTEWLCVSRGKGTITAVQYAETPIADVAGASYTVFEPTGGAYPELGTTTITDVVETFECDDVNGQEIKAPGSPEDSLFGTGSADIAVGVATFYLQVTDGEKCAAIKALAPSGTATVTFTYGSGPTSFSAVCTIASYTVFSGLCEFEIVAPSGMAETYSGLVAPVSMTPTGGSAASLIGPFTLPLDSQRIRWNTIFPRGLKGAVEIEATWWKIDSGGVEVSGSREVETFEYEANTGDGRYFTTEVTPTAGTGRYRIQFERITAEIGSGVYDLAKLEAVYAVRYYATKVLPGDTIIRITTKATEQATGFADRKFNLRWQRHVRTLSSSAISASRNFARAMAHMWVVAGKNLAELDTTALAAINTEFGETSSLLRFDFSFDDRDVSLGERLQIIANHARCVVWRDGTQWTVTRDQARQYPEVQLDYRNLAQDGESAISVASHLPASYDGIELEYVNETTQAQKAYIRLTIASGSVSTGSGTNPKKIALPGCTTQAQAENRARLEARKLLYQRTSVTDKALSDVLPLGVGALVRWVDPEDFGGIADDLQAGEVMSIAGSVITTSEPLEWGAATSGRIMFTGDAGERLAAPVVCTPNADGSVTLASVPSGLYLRGTGGAQLGSRYLFATGLTSGELESAGLYTLTEARPSGDGTVSIALAAYDARIYADD